MRFATYPSLKDATVLVTGGATGIGADFVTAFSEQGARVGFIDIQDGPGAELADETGAIFGHANITDISTFRQTIAELEQQLGPFRILINNAANDMRESVGAISEASWDLSQNINLRAQFFAAQAVQQGMAAAGGGSIVNISSIVWKLDGRNLVSYATAKAGVIGLTKSLAHAFGSDNIRVNAIEPGAVFTPRQRELWFKTEADVEAMVARQLINRPIDGDDIARMALFLASDDARMITNQVFTIDAGML